MANDNASRWLASNGIGPILAAIGSSANPGDWGEALRIAHPELDMEDADRLVAYGLQARSAALAGAPGALAPTEPEPDGSEPPRGKMLSWRYRIRTIFRRGPNQRDVYRTVEITSDGQLDDEELADAVGEMASDMADSGQSDLSGQTYIGFDVIAETRFTR